MPCPSDKSIAPLSCERLRKLVRKHEYNSGIIEGILRAHTEAGGKTPPDLSHMHLNPLFGDLFKNLYPNQ